MAINTGNLSEVLEARANLARDIASYNRTLRELSQQVRETVNAIGRTKTKYAQASVDVSKKDAEGDVAITAEKAYWAELTQEFADLETKAAAMQTAVDSVTV